MDNYFRIKTLNKIAPEGLELFSDRYRIDPGETDPHGIVVRSAPLDTDDYPSLLAVARAGAGVNNITVEKATERGICVFNAPGANANAVAELVFAMLGVGARNIVQGVEFCRSLRGLPDEEISRQVESRKSSFRGFELAGKTLGVLGLGKIGVRVANLGVSHHMRVMGFDPLPSLENIHALSPDVELVRSIGEVARDCHVLSVHVPFSDTTKGLVDAGLIRRLPRDAILINYARGPIVDDGAVLSALADGHLGMYITDFPTAELLAHPNVVPSPHLGASTEESEELCSIMAIKELKSYLERGTVTNSVNFPNAEQIPSRGVHTRLVMINRDVPGMIGFASQLIGSHGINIASYLNESNGVVGYNIIDLEAPVPPAVLSEIEHHDGVIRVRTIDCSGEC